MLRAGEKWNSTNAKELFDYASQHGYKMNFELGNEPELYEHQFNCTITGAQIADGYNDLRTLLNTYDLFKDSVLFTAFNSPSGLIYYMANATLEEFLSPKVMNSLINELKAGQNFNFSSKWISETGSTWLANDGTDDYVAGFWWLDKLGLAALYGLEAVIREDILGAKYALLNDTMSPRPDYWLSFFHKKLVGQQVFNTTFEPADENFRIYAASSTVDNNSIVVYGMRLTNDTISLDFPNVSNKQVTLYILKESEPGNLYSKSSRLNGDLIEWYHHQALPNVRGQTATLPIQIDGISLFFIVVNQTEVASESCPDGWYKLNSNPNKCIRIVNDPQPLFSAKFSCTFYGKNGGILSVDTAFENSEIRGQTGTSGCGELYLGLVRNGSDWTWSNSDQATYRNWKNGYPTTDANQNCVAIDSTDGTWKNVDCDDFQCYICQQNI